jgi:CDP-paratose 2-epimerase
MVQEYGRYFGMPTCALRGGCLTGPSHSGVELHAFLSYLIKCNLRGTKYNVYGYKGKQVRDNIHSLDVARFIADFIAKPRAGEVYNIGGGRSNSCSILKAFAKIAAISGKPMVYEYQEQNRSGDLICYISDLRKMREHYPGWDIRNRSTTSSWKSTPRGPIGQRQPNDWWDKHTAATFFRIVQSCLCRLHRADH